MQLDCAGAFTLDRNWSDGGAFALEATDADAPFEELARGAVVPDEPVAFAARGRQKIGDIVGTTWPGLEVVSPKVVRCLTDHGFTGWSTFPIRVTGRRATELADHVGLSVTGRAGPIDDSRSDRVLLPVRPGGDPRPHLRGLFPRADSWDGSDLFLPAETLWLCVTDAVRAALVKAGVGGVSFQRMSDVTRWLWDE